MITVKSKLPILIIFTALIPLAISIFNSGYHYVFDNDELNHVQLMYLYAQGLRPYLDIYNSVYSPLFEWFLMPLFTIFGFSFSTIYLARYVMIVLFALRVMVSFVLVRKIFGARIAYIFVPMFLLDPFVVFSSMQARPDNLMMTTYTIGLLFWAHAMTAPKASRIFWAGFFLALPLLILPKVLPSVGILIIASLIHLFIKKKPGFIVPGMLGFLTPVAIFSSYFLMQGSFAEMFRQSILEAKAAYSYFSISIPLGNFYIPDNFYIYGAMGKPLSWFYAWMLPYAAVIGAYIVISGKKNLLKITLALTLLAQWTVLFFLQVVFMQHYLPISWLYAVFAAVLVDSILTLFRPAFIPLIFVCLLLIFTSVKTNNARSYVNSKELITAVTKRWKEIPEGSYTFPNYLFRPSMYPITYGYFIGNVPPVILNRLPSITKKLEEHKVQYLLIDDYLMNKLSPEVQTYIRMHYARVPGDPELMLLSK